MKTFILILLLIPNLGWPDSQKNVLKKFCDGYYEFVLKEELEILNKSFEALKDVNEKNSQWVEDNFSKIERADEIIWDQGYKWSIICSKK